MINIAICEDNPEEMRIGKALLEEELQHFFPEFTLTEYSCGKSLCHAVESGELLPQLLFLDIFLEDMTGIEVAQFLRSRQIPVQIVLITSSREYAMESYHINAAYYLVKPLEQKWLRLAVERAVRLMNEEQTQPFLELKKERDTIRIPQSSICYVETFGNKTFIHTTNEDISIYKPLKEIASMLPNEKFVLIQRGILANLRYIKSIQNNVCTLENGISFALSRKNSPVIREKYFDYMFKHPPF